MTKPYTDPNWPPPEPPPEDVTRDRSFGPAVQAAVERAAEARKIANSTFVTENFTSGLRSDTCAAGAPGIAGTITPPTAEPLSPYLRAELGRIAAEMDRARAALREILERS